MGILVDRRKILLGAAGAAGALMLPVLPGRALEAIKPLRTGRHQIFDLDWRFRRGEGENWEASDHDDASWRRLDLPHDWSIEDLPPGQPEDAKAQVLGPFDRSAVGGTATGYAVGGEGWYRKHFKVDTPAEERTEILFEGVYMNADVWLNGSHLGTHHCGYTPFGFDLTPHLIAGGNNVLAVRVRNLGKNSRWYSGSGIERHVWLDVLEGPARIARWGVGIVVRQIGDAGAEVSVNTRLHDAAVGDLLVTRVRDDRGRAVAEISAPAASSSLDQTLTVAAPRLWSPDSPSLYLLESELRRGGRLLDSASNSFGIRVITFDPQQGMAINGKPTKMRGGCIHHDNGLLGAAAFDAAEERKVLLLKARGFNAVRPSHNLFSPAFLNACDRHGLLVVEETFDAWREPKLADDYSVDFDADWQSDLEAMVLSTRNHPSIVMWSIGNEIPERNTRQGVETQWRLANGVHKLDPSRPVTAAINGFAGQMVKPSQDTARAGTAGEADQTSTIFLDVVGYNYKLDDYEADHGRFPSRILFGSESFANDAARIWALTDKSPWLIGDFVWTAMDYLGEAGIGGSLVVAESAAAGPMPRLSQWPWINAFCGDIDLIGQPKASSRARDVIWGLSALEVAVQRPLPAGKGDRAATWGWHDELPSWTWPGNEGRPLTVRVYTSGDRVELHLNDRLVASRSVLPADLKRVELTADYASGALEAIAFRDGREIARQKLRTLGTPAAIRLTPERTTGGRMSGDVSYVLVEVTDAKGLTVVDLETPLNLTVTGPAQLIAFGSANPLAKGSFQSVQSQTWNGRALVIVRGTATAGRVQFEVTGPGLRPGKAQIRLG